MIEPIETHVTITETLFSELEEADGAANLDAMTDEWLEGVRARILSGELPAFITPDYVEGWRLYARANIADRLIRHRRRVNGHNIRRFYPTLRAMEAGRMWLDGEEHEDAAEAHAIDRYQAQLASAVNFEGRTQVALGLATWDEVEQYGHQVIQSVVQECKSATKKAAPRKKRKAVA